LALLGHLQLRRNSASARGLGTTKDIRKLIGTRGDLTGRTEWLYHRTIMGEPSATEPWGWQLDGHHVVVNYFILGDQVVMTPHFLGSEARNRCEPTPESSRARSFFRRNKKLVSNLHVS